MLKLLIVLPGSICSRLGRAVNRPPRTSLDWVRERVGGHVSAPSNPRAAPLPSRLVASCIQCHVSLQNAQSPASSSLLLRGPMPRPRCACCADLNHSSRRCPLTPSKPASSTGMLCSSQLQHPALHSEAHLHAQCPTHPPLAGTPAWVLVVREGSQNRALLPQISSLPWQDASCSGFCPGVQLPYPYPCHLLLSMLGCAGQRGASTIRSPPAGRQLRAGGKPPVDVLATAVRVFRVLLPEDRLPATLQISCIHGSTAPVCGLAHLHPAGHEPMMPPPEKASSS